MPMDGTSPLPVLAACAVASIFGLYAWRRRRHGSRHLALQQFVAQRAAFLADAVLASAVRGWEAGETEGIFLDAAHSTAAAGTMPAKAPPHMRGKPIFQCLLEDVAKGTKLAAAFTTVLYADDECVVFIPSGFKGRQEDGQRDEDVLEAFQASALQQLQHSADSRARGKAIGELAQATLDQLTRTPLGMNPSSLAQGGGAALMSLAHALVIPRRRIYNAVTLTAEDAPLIKHLEAVGRAVVAALLRADGRTARQTVEPLAAVPSSLEELEAAAYLPGGLCLGSECAAQLATATATTFHVHPMQSVGWLHMHAYCDALRTSAFHAMDEKARHKVLPHGAGDGYPKNTSSAVVLASFGC